MFFVLMTMYRWMRCRYQKRETLLFYSKRLYLCVRTIEMLRKLWVNTDISHSWEFCFHISHCIGVISAELAAQVCRRDLAMDTWNFGEYVTIRQMVPISLWQIWRMSQDFVINLWYFWVTGPWKLIFWNLPNLWKQIAYLYTRIAEPSRMHNFVKLGRNR